MSGWSTSFLSPMTLGALRAVIEGLPDDYLLEVPSLNRRRGEFIYADHVFIDPREKTVTLDGDIADEVGHVG